MNFQQIGGGFWGVEYDFAREFHVRSADWRFELLGRYEFVLTLYCVNPAMSCLDMHRPGGGGY